jgi:hypothetical protein
VADKDIKGLGGKQTNAILFSLQAFKTSGIK